VEFAIILFFLCVWSILTRYWFICLPAAIIAVVMMCQHRSFNAGLTLLIVECVIVSIIAAVAVMGVGK